MGDAFYYRSEPKKWLVGMATLTPEQRGVYRTLCDMMYDQGGFVPADDRQGLACSNRCSTRKFNKVLAELISLKKIIEIDGLLTNKTVLKTIKDKFILRLSLKKRILTKQEINESNDLEIVTSKESTVSNHPLNPQEKERGIPNFNDFWQKYRATSTQNYSICARLFYEQEECHQWDIIDSVSSYNAELDKTKAIPSYPYNYIKHEMWKEFDAKPSVPNQVVGKRGPNPDAWLAWNAYHKAEGNKFASTQETLTVPTLYPPKKENAA